MSSIPARIDSCASRNLMRLIIKRAWCFSIGLTQVFFGLANFLLPLGQAGLGMGWAVVYILLPLAAGVTLLLVASRRRCHAGRKPDKETAETTTRRKP